MALCVILMKNKRMNKGIHLVIRQSIYRIWDLRLFISGFMGC